LRHAYGRLDDAFKRRLNTAFQLVD
jgi:hypothetical protein